MNQMNNTLESDRPSFSLNEDSWFAEPRRESVRPSRPVPPMPPPIDDAIADSWFL